MPRRIIMRIELTPSAKKKLNAYCDKSGKTQVSAVSRLVESFTALAPEVQALLMNDIPAEIEPEYTKLILQRLSPG